MFSPMAYTLGFALLGALLFTLTLVPMLTSVLLKKNVKEKHNPFTEFLTNNAIRFFYICRRHKRKTLIVSITVMIAGLCLAPNFFQNLTKDQYICVHQCQAAYHSTNL